MPDSLPTTKLPSQLAPLKRRRYRRWLRILLWTAAGLLVLLLLIAGAGVLWLRSAARAALPQLDGDVHLAGLSAPVTVRRDAHGVPHIDAATQDDMLVAQGYVTAQDRLWQMDSLRRSANGELAEIMGSALVKHDKTQRVLQIRITAQRIYDHLPPPIARASTTTPAASISSSRNASSRIRSRSSSVCSMYRPQPWSGVDSISVGLLMVESSIRMPRPSSRAHASPPGSTTPKLEADLYPVGSWRDRPPTGVKVDLSEPQPLPPPTKK